MTLVIWAMFFLPLSVISRGFVLSYLWAWFFVPLGLPPISTAHALGIALFILSCQEQPQLKNNTENKLGDLSIQIIVMAGMLILFGLILRHLM